MLIEWEWFAIVGSTINLFSLLRLSSDRMSRNVILFGKVALLTMYILVNNHI